MCALDSFCVNEIVMQHSIVERVFVAPRTKCQHNRTTSTTAESQQIQLGILNVSGKSNVWTWSASR